MRRWLLSQGTGRATCVLLVACVGVFFASPRARASDAALLVQMLATEVAAYAELGAILGEAAALAAQVEQYTALAKSAWGAVDELRTLTAGELMAESLTGLRAAFPEADAIYGSVRAIRDLDRADPKALATLRGMLWEELYGPVVDEVHYGHETLTALALIADQGMRHALKSDAYRSNATRWLDDCQRTAQEGEFGACQVGSDFAVLQASKQLADIDESIQGLLRAEEIQMKAQARREGAKANAYARFRFDLRNAFASRGTGTSTCAPEACLYETYASKAQERLALLRARHPHSGTGGSR